MKKDIKKAIVFDLDGTLCFSYPDRPEKYTGLEAPTGIFEQEVVKYPDSYDIIILT